jgi:hypothetical protein
MEKTTILNNLQLIHNGQQIDGRALRSLKRNGYVDSSGLLTAWGFRELGVYRHVPQLPVVDPASYHDQHAMITETMYRTCDCCGDGTTIDYSESYTISVEKLAEQYNQYATLVNDYVKEHCWDHQLDEMVDHGWAHGNVQKRMLQLAEGKIWFSDFNYTWHILKGLMQGILDGRTSIDISTSFKYSITDTVNEIKDLVSNGPAKYLMNVEVNR